MNDTEKMGIVGTKLFWQLFTRSTFCKGHSDIKLKEHVKLFKLFMYWARLTNRKMLIRNMFFDLTGYSPFHFLELLIDKISRPYFKYATPKDAWMDIFRFNLCPLSIGIGGVTRGEIYGKLLVIEHDWRTFLEKNLDKI